MKVLLAVDGSEYSAQAVEAVASRQWSPDVVVRVLSAVENVSLPTIEPLYGTGVGVQNLEGLQQEMVKSAEQLTASVAERLHSRGLMTETSVQYGDPREVIVDEARKWSADLIIMGSHGYTGIKRLLLGSVAQSVVAHAPCSVEVVRRKQTKEV